MSLDAEKFGRRVNTGSSLNVITVSGKHSNGPDGLKLTQG